ncbi:MULTISPECIES: DUF6614 family protein [Roseovarius]|uniref:DUF6614 family protein n=1 Tax=Roseovarius TaxID=74030 RepID=UPI00308426B7
MNVYTCQIDLKKDAKSLPFAAALEDWKSHLQAGGDGRKLLAVAPQAEPGFGCPSRLPVANRAVRLGAT